MIVLGGLTKNQAKYLKRRFLFYQKAFLPANQKAVRKRKYRSCSNNYLAHHLQHKQKNHFGQCGFVDGLTAFSSNVWINCI